MRADSWFRQYWFFAFPLPFFPLRYVFATPSDRLRDRSRKAFGLSNLRSDSPLDSVHVGRSYLDPIGASNGSGTLGSLSVSHVVVANGLLGLLFDTDSSAQALVLDGIVHSRPERWDNQLSTNVAPQLLTTVLIPFPCACARESVSGTCWAIPISLRGVRTVEPYVRDDRKGDQLCRKVAEQYDLIRCLPPPTLACVEMPVSSMS